MRPFDVFICYKKSSGKDFADHLKSGLEELGYHAFLDSKDLSRVVDGQEEWSDVRDQALKESNVFILIITPGFDLSQEVRNELALARQQIGNKHFIYFRHRDLGRKIVIDLLNEKLDLGKQEQVSFETKEELLRLAHGLLLKIDQKINTTPTTIAISAVPNRINSQEKMKEVGSKKLGTSSPLICEMCCRPILGTPHVESVGDQTLNFDSKECAKMFRKLKSVYGQDFR